MVARISIIAEQYQITAALQKILVHARMIQSPYNCSISCGIAVTPQYLVDGKGNQSSLAFRRNRFRLNGGNHAVSQFAGAIFLCPTQKVT